MLLGAGKAVLARQQATLTLRFSLQNSAAAQRSQQTPAALLTGLRFKTTKAAATTVSAQKTEAKKPIAAQPKSKSPPAAQAGKAKEAPVKKTATKTTSTTVKKSISAKPASKNVRVKAKEQAAKGLSDATMARLLREKERAKKAADLAKEKAKKVADLAKEKEIAKKAAVLAKEKERKAAVLLLQKERKAATIAREKERKAATIARQKAREAEKLEKAKQRVKAQLLRKKALDEKLKIKKQSLRSRALERARQAREKLRAKAREQRQKKLLMQKKETEKRINHKKSLKGVLEANLPASLAQTMPPIPGKNHNLMGYGVYCKELFGNKEVSSVIEARRKWVELSEAERQKYDAIGKQDDAEKRKAFEQWLNSTPGSMIIAANLARQRIRAAYKAAGKNCPSLYKPIVDSRAPKRPAPPFIMWFTANDKLNLPPGVDVTTIKSAIGEKAKELGAKWNALTDEQKAPIIAEYKKVHANYEKALAAYTASA